MTDQSHGDPELCPVCGLFRRDHAVVGKTPTLVALGFERDPFPHLVLPIDDSGTWRL